MTLLPCRLVVCRPLSGCSSSIRLWACSLGVLLAYTTSTLCQTFHPYVRLAYHQTTT
jgi:hypothetical protein